ncbi:MAG TPA: sigma-70 family RNA polymerase sigma factor [Terriglobales bacterium]|nr:sigma-70 family RNA polymerase sigma factor [Terriglobales bacterium]
MYNINELDEPVQTAATEQLSVAVIEEDELLSRARAGDATAFESLVMPHKETIFRIAQRILRNREDAEDVVQIAFLDALRHLDAFQGRSRFASWLKTIAVNAAFMRLRVRRRNVVSLDQLVDYSDGAPRLQLMESRPNPEQELSTKEARSLLDKALRRLGPIHVDVFRMRDVQELSAKETAQILGVPVGTVKARLHRARTKIIRRAQSTLLRRQTAGCRTPSHLGRNASNYSATASD